MLQIKTIADKLTDRFDDRVNKALEEGWALTRRYYTPNEYFAAELERVVVTDAERTCENCIYSNNRSDVEPCCNCSPDADKWEPMEGLTALTEKE